MKGFRVARHGGREALEWGEWADPVPGPGEVTVRVRACALNHLDLWLRNGVPGHRFPLPLVPGSEVAGTVDALGRTTQVLEDTKTGGANWRTDYVYDKIDNLLFVRPQATVRPNYKR